MTIVFDGGAATARRDDERVKFTIHLLSVLQCPNKVLRQGMAAVLAHVVGNGATTISTQDFHLIAKPGQQTDRRRINFRCQTCWAQPGKIATRPLSASPCAPGRSVFAAAGSWLGARSMAAFNGFGKAKRNQRPSGATVSNVRNKRGLAVRTPRNLGKDAQKAADCTAPQPICGHDQSNARNGRPLGRLSYRPGNPSNDPSAARHPVLAPGRSPAYL